MTQVGGHPEFKPQCHQKKKRKGILKDSVGRIERNQPENVKHWQEASRDSEQGGPPKVVHSHSTVFDCHQNAAHRAQVGINSPVTRSSCASPLLVFYIGPTHLEARKHVSWSAIHRSGCRDNLREEERSI
jgi:hypothetical protein